jgi:hypothetical protein
MADDLERAVILIVATGGKLGEDAMQIVYGILASRPGKRLILIVLGMLS